MKKVLQSFAVCFSMYSRIPMPRVEWNAYSMLYVFFFFPFVGLVIGALQLGWFWLAYIWDITPVLYAAVAVSLPILITGGIHLDGYMDTCDALFSYGDREKKLAIMKDPNAGAFAVIYCGVYLILSAGLFVQLYAAKSWPNVLFVSVGYLLSRAVCGLAAVGMQCAKNSGLAYLFQNGADKKLTRIALIVWAAVLLGALALISWKSALAAVILLGIAALLFVRTVKKQFGGITGDLAGFLLQICEIILLAAAVVL